KALALLPPEPALELIPPDLCAAHGLASLREALLTVHRPPPDARLDLLLQGRHPAQQRLAFEELLTQHLSLKRTRAAMQRRRSPSRNSAWMRKCAAISRKRSRCCGWCRATWARARPWSPRWPRWPRWSRAARWR